MLSCKGCQRRSPQSSAPRTCPCHFEGRFIIFKFKAARKEDEEAIVDFRLYLASYHHGRTDGALKVIL